MPKSRVRQRPHKRSRCDSNTLDADESRTEVEMKNPMATWNGLPAELRGIVIDHLALSAVPNCKSSKGSRGKNGKSARGVGGMGNYAVVCKQWQGVIEKYNFNSLEISSAKDLSRFDEVMKDPRRRSLLRRLSLCIDLPRYSKKLAKVPETDVEMNDNEVAFTQGIWNTFDILSKWTLPQDSPGIELELSAASPSDKDELWGEAGLDFDGLSRFFDHDLDFSWITAGCEQVGRHGLPEVPIVSSCQILRRNHRNFSPQALLTIYSCLPQLREIRYEPWHQVDMEAQLEVDSDHARALPFYPSNVKRISIFEHFDAFNDGAGGEEWEDAESSSSSSSSSSSNGDNVAVTSPLGNFPDNLSDIFVTDTGEESRTSCPSLGQNLCWLSFQTEEMSVSHVADASSFFGSFLSRKPPMPVWTQLRRLTLTSHTMISGVEPDKINNVLKLTATAAKQMPVLKMLELYKVDQFGAAVFRYTADEMSATAAWESTWEFRVEERVRKAWAEVAYKNTFRELEFLPEVMLGEYRGPFIFINDNLRSKDLVVHPASLKDMLAKEMNKCKACHGFCAYPKMSATALGLTPTVSDAAIDLVGESD